MTLKFVFHQIPFIFTHVSTICDFCSLLHGQLQINLNKCLKQNKKHLNITKRESLELTNHFTKKDVACWVKKPHTHGAKLTILFGAFGFPRWHPC